MIICYYYHYYEWQQVSEHEALVNKEGQSRDICTPRKQHLSSVLGGFAKRGAKTQFCLSYSLIVLKDSYPTLTGTRRARTGK